MPSYLSPSTNVEIVSGSALQIAASGLSAGQSVNFTTQSAFGEALIAWNHKYFYDPVNERVHLLGKAANSTSGWAHQYYDIATDQFVSVDMSHVNGQGSPGHIYGNADIDPGTGKIWLGLGYNTNYLQVYDPSSGWADETAIWRGGLSFGSFAPFHNGLGFVPDLYGSGNDGVLLKNANYVMSWNINTNTWEDVSTFTGDANPRGIGTYVSGLGCLMGRDNTTSHRMGVTGSTPSATALNPGIQMGGYSALESQNFYHVHESPDGNSYWALRAAGGSDVLQSTTGENWSQVDTHPFDAQYQAFVKLPAPYNCYWGIGITGSTHMSRLWKPS